MNKMKKIKQILLYKNINVIFILLLMIKII